MEKSQSIKNIAAAMKTFHSRVGTIKKDASNPFFKNRYASLSNILESIHEPLQEAGLSFVQFPEGEHELTTVIMHIESGEFMQSTYNMKPIKDDPQGLGSTITYQRRYALSAILGLNIDADDDGNAGSAPKMVFPMKDVQDNRPWLSEKQFNSALSRHEAGDTTVARKTLETFRMKKEYRAKLDALISPANTQKE